MNGYDVFKTTKSDYEEGKIQGIKGGDFEFNATKYPWEIVKGVAKPQGLYVSGDKAEDTSWWSKDSSWWGLKKTDKAAYLDPQPTQLPSQSFAGFDPPLTPFNEYSDSEWKVEGLPHIELTFELERDYRNKVEGWINDEINALLKDMGRLEGKLDVIRKYIMIEYKEYEDGSDNSSTIEQRRRDAQSAISGLNAPHQGDLAGEYNGVTSSVKGITSQAAASKAVAAIDSAIGLIESRQGEWNARLKAQESWRNNVIEPQLDEYNKHQGNIRKALHKYYECASVLNNSGTEQIEGLLEKAQEKK